MLGPARGWLGLREDADTVMDIKKSLPYPVKQALYYAWGAIPLPVRYGKVFRDTYSFLQKSQWWSREQLEQYQKEQLARLLNHAYQNVPYYRKIFDERRLKPADIKGPQDLVLLPYLTKEIIRGQSADLLAKNVPNKLLQYVTTGGSTGAPLGFYIHRNMTEAQEWAFVWRQWNWAGYSFGERKVVLRGGMIHGFRKGQRKKWEYRPSDKSLILSSYDLTEENLKVYFDLINKFKPTAIQGYPSSLYILANFLKDNNLELSNLRCVLTSSENLYPHQKETIEHFLGGKIYDHYGNTERNVLIMQCEKGNYHSIVEYGITELIEITEGYLSGDEQRREVVGTGFLNYAMPLIRYKTGDIVVLTDRACSCGKKYPIIERIEGREQEYIVTKNNDAIPLNTAIFSIHEKEWANVKKIQFLQEKKGELVIFLIPSALANPPELAAYVLSLFKQKLGDHFTLEIKVVDEIQLTERGKQRILIQKIPL